MLLSRFKKVADDLAKEYADFRIVELLQQAVGISAQRGPLGQGYPAEARKIRDQAQQILNNSVLNSYPSDIRRLLEASAYSSVLPTRLARILLAGFPANLQFTITSSELNIYVPEAQNFLNAMLTVGAVASSFSTNLIQIPDGLVALEAVLIASSEGRRSDQFERLFGRVSRILSYFIELTTGSEGSPQILYLSTSDPTVGLAMYAGAAWGALKLWKLLLEIAEKQVGLYKTLRELRKAEVETSEFEEKTKIISRRDLDGAVEASIAASPAKVPESRVNEIKVAIRKDVGGLLEAILQGSTLSLAIESFDRIPLFTASIPGLDDAAVRVELLSQKDFADALRVAVERAGLPPPALLPSSD